MNRDGAATHAGDPGRFWLPRVSSVPGAGNAYKGVPIGRWFMPDTYVANGFVGMTLMMIPFTGCDAVAIANAMADRAGYRGRWA